MTTQGHKAEGLWGKYKQMKRAIQLYFWPTKKPQHPRLKSRVHFCISISLPTFLSLFTVNCPITIKSLNQYLTSMSWVPEKCLWCILSADLLLNGQVTGPVRLAVMGDILDLQRCISVTDVALWHSHWKLDPRGHRHAPYDTVMKTLNLWHDLWH